MKKVQLCTLCGLLLLAAPLASYAYSVTCDFNSPWSGDYAPGWQNTDYRYGEAPAGKMMEYVMGGRDGTGAMRLIAATAPRPTDFWAIVNVQDANVNASAMQKQYDPWMSVWYYDRGWESGSLHQAGQLYAVPSWVNMYIDDNGDGIADSDWTDIQYGSRMSMAPPDDKYYMVTAGENMTGWMSTGVSRVSDNWVQLKMQLLHTDGKVHFYLRSDESLPWQEVGQSDRNDYSDLLTPALATMYTSPLSNWVNNKPSTIWDNFAYGSDYVPEPASMTVLAGAFVGLGLFRKRK